MARRQFFIPRDSIREGTATLPPDQAHHLRNVLRLKAGELVELINGEGRRYVGEIELHGSAVRIRGVKSISSQPPPSRLILASALIKSTRFEWILQKATELGVEEIIPLNTHFSEIRIPDNRLGFRMERWKRIVREASKQCRRLTIPQVRNPLPYSDFIGSSDFSAFTRLFLYEKAAGLWQYEGSFSDRIILCIGPEGGWDSKEIEQAKEAGYQIFSLGPWILRAETAAVAAIAVTQFKILDLKSSSLKPRPY